MVWSSQSRREQNAWPSPIQSWRHALRAFVLCWIIVGSLLILVPELIPLAAVMAVVSSLVAWRIRKRLRQYTAVRLGLLQDRKFRVPHLPIAPEDQAPSVQRWRSPGIPYQVRYEQITVDGVPVTRAVKVLDPAFHAAAEAIKDHCRERYPALFASVMEWWKKECLAPVWEERSGGVLFQDLSPDQRRHLKSLVEVDLLEGICEALNPSRWTRKYDRRDTMVRVQRLRNRLKAHHGDLEIDVDAVPWITFPIRQKIYFGRGFVWHPRHAERMCIETSKDLDVIAQEVLPSADVPAIVRRVDGDPRAYGVGAEEERDLFFDEAQFSQHAVVLGGSGFGKSRCIEAPLQTAIGNGDPVFVLDPKGDPRLINMVVETARRYGRSHDFQFMSLVEPYHPEVCSYNPLADYLQPTELQGRVMAVIPPSKEQFFVEEAASTGRVVGTLCHWISRYLGVLSGGDHLAHTPPELLLWLHYCHLERVVGGNPLAVSRAVEAFDALYARLVREDYWFAPQNDTERALKRLWRCSFYHAATWNPTFGHMSLYGVQRPYRLVSWAVRLVFYHVFADTKGTVCDYSDLEWPLRDSRADVCGSDDRVGVINLLNRSPIHPLSPQAAAVQQASMAAWRPLYEAKAPTDHRRAQLQHILDQLDETLQEQISAAELLKEDYDKRNSSLKSPVSTLAAGGKRRILCDPDPDISWKRVVGEQRIVYLALGQMVDRAGSNAVCKTVIQGLTAHLGQVLARQADNPPRLWFFGDEMPSWATPEWADIIDKARSAGIRTFNLSQTIAGLTAAVGDRNKVLHMLGSFASTWQFGVQNDEDCQLFAKMCGSVQLMLPNRSVSINPGIGNAGNTIISGYSANESRSFQERQVTIVDPSQVARMPIGQAYVRRFGKVYLMQIGLLPTPQTDYLKEIGIDGECFQSGGASSHQPLWWTPPRTARADTAASPPSPSALPSTPTSPDQTQHDEHQTSDSAQWEGPPPGFWGTDTASFDPDENVLSPPNSCGHIVSAPDESPHSSAHDQDGSLPSQEVMTALHSTAAVTTKGVSTTDLVVAPDCNALAFASPALRRQQGAASPRQESPAHDHPVATVSEPPVRSLEEALSVMMLLNTLNAMVSDMTPVVQEDAEPGVDNDPEQITIQMDNGYGVTGPCVEGRLHGEISIRHPGGAVFGVGRYRRGVPDGTWSFFDSHGSALGQHSYTGPFVR